MNFEIHWPPGVDTSVFLSEYWQKQSLLIRYAFRNFENPLSPDELAGLACEENIASRIIYHNAKDEWTVEHGPFSESTFETLGDANWSLLVSDIEEHIPTFIDYVEAFRFIPDWRIDDLMISYAPTGASVGPHTDNYDVFLFQASGTRKWEIGSSSDLNTALIPNLDIKILKDFTASRIFLLKPGDLLYLPPGLAHHGISQDMNCMTWSFGFRAPTINAMIEGFANYLSNQLPDQLMYEDRNLKIQNNPGEITVESQKKLLRMLQDKFITDETIFARWIGRFLTESGTSDFSEHQGTSFEKQLQQSKSFTRCTQSKMAYISGEECCTLFVNGEAYLTKPELAEFLCAAYSYSKEQLKTFYAMDANKSLLETLFQSDVIIPMA